jgi:hypothetical protein
MVDNPTNSEERRHWAEAFPMCKYFFIVPLQMSDVEDATNPFRRVSNERRDGGNAAEQDAGQRLHTSEPRGDATGEPGDFRGRRDGKWLQIIR